VVFPVAGLLFSLLGQPTVPGQILFAQGLVAAVRREAQALLSAAPSAGSVPVSENQLRAWEASLVTAVDVLGRVPATLIFPPPAYVTYIQQATVQINLALEIIRSIPIAAPLIFPPVPGGALVSVVVLQSLVAALLRAEALLGLAAQSAAVAG